MTNSRFKVQLVKSPIGRPGKHRRILEAIGLTRINRVVDLLDVPEMRGMINKVSHLVKVVA